MVSHIHTLANADSGPFWEAAADGRLALQKCAACGAVQFPPREHCAECWEAAPGWIDSSGRGRIESFTIVRRAPLPAFRDKVPYVIAAIRVEEGPRLITRLLGEDALDAAIDDEVTLSIETDDAGRALPCFRRA